MVMPLSFYRRHRRDCKAGHAEDTRTGEFDERKKGYRRCDCPLFTSGTLAREFKRQSTGQWEWEPAKAVAGEWATAGSWTVSDNIAPSQGKSERSDLPTRTTIGEAAETFLAVSRNRELSPASLAKYRTFNNQLLTYAESRGYVLLDQLTVADMDRFYASWKDGKRARAKKLERLRSFIRFCVKRKWLAENIAEDWKAPEGSSIPANKTPFTDAEMERIFAACAAIGEPTQPGPGYRNWGGRDVEDFILLSIYTGLRISDVATFDIAKRLKGNDVFLRMHKTRKELWTWIPDWLVARLRDRERKHGSLIFQTGESRSVRTMAELWRVKIGKVFKLSAPFEEPPVPHRFRHTFVRILLEKGVPVADVAELIGDTEEIVRKHYSRWVPERQAGLTRVLKEAFDDRAKPKLVALPTAR